MSIRVVESDPSGTILTTSVGQVVSVEKSSRTGGGTKKIRIQDFLVKLFLPSGYPSSVTPDYLHFQILNGLQAFCNSVSGLISSRAILEGSGVGDASASATQALLVNILQDIFSRLTTIVAAFYIGTSLFPEAKTYRIVADILNDLAIILDVLSPLLNTISLSLWGLFPHSRSLRILALCLSGSVRSVCSIAAGGSKTAMSTHFSTPATGRGDLGDLTAKESSLETVLCLIGMVAGTLIIPHLTTLRSTYTVLFTLLVIHLASNYIAVRGIVFRTLNRQRTTICWTTYRQSDNTRVPSPGQVAITERILDWPGLVRDCRTGKPIGHCTVGSSLTTIMRKPVPVGLLSFFDSEHYVIWFDERTLPCVPGILGTANLRLHICLKEGHTTSDLLKAWVHAVEVGMIWDRLMAPLGIVTENQGSVADIIRMAYRTVEEHLSTFVDRMRQAGWDTDGRGIMTGIPRTLLISVKDGLVPETNGDTAMEARKDV